MSFARRAGGALLTTGLVATMGLGSYWSAQSLQSTLADQARAALESHALEATVRFDGRDATVWASSAAARDQAVAALLTVPGVRVVAVGDGNPPEVASAGSTVTVSHASSASRPSATATASDSPSGTTTPTVAVTPTSSSTPTVSSTPTASASPLTAAAVPTATATPVTIPVWPAIQFLGGTSALDGADRTELAQVARFMVANPTVKVTLTGHTDMGRTDAERQALGLARAKAAAAYLTANGVAAPRVTTLTGGGNDPVASNATAAGRAANRRVTIAMNQES